MVEHRTRAVQMFSQEEIFRAIAYGALKARAGRLAPGEIMLIGEFELAVAEDENGDGVVVQIIETMAKMESLALDKMRSQDTTIDEPGVSMSGEPGWRPSGKIWLSISTSGRISK